MRSANSYDGLEIAIIGMSGQFPSSRDCDMFWKNLMAGKGLVKKYSDEELIKLGVRSEELTNSQYVKLAATLEEKDFFDHTFFDYRPDEAALMDPQIRLFHTHCWKALEDAGYTSETEKQKIGLFATASDNDNWKIYSRAKAQHVSVDPLFLNAISNQKYISSLVAYKLNFQGPVAYIDSACSSSLTAIHIACRSLLTRECTLALSGGVSISTVVRKGYHYQEGMILSSDGHCMTFDREASGTISGEGVGVVVLRRLSDAIKNKDHIYAIIRSSAINNDGNDKVGFAAPSVKGQSECIKAAHKTGGVDPRTISYIEAHGTATILGDPIEIKALNLAFQATGKEKYCAIGSVKSNMGHLDAAAGVAGLIKATLSLKHRKIPPSLDFKDPNPEIDFDGGPFFVNTELREWHPRDKNPLRAGVSSFGIGGTNAHVVLEEAPIDTQVSGEKKLNLLLLSAKSKNSLSRYLEEIRTFLFGNETIDLADMAYSFQVGRKHFNHRQFVSFTDRDDLLQKLIPHENMSRLATNAEPNLVFMFQGLGSQYVNMGRDLYENEPLFKNEMDKGFRFLKTLNGKDYKEVIYPSGPESDDIHNPVYAQPIIFIFEHALARLAMSWGLKPKYMIVHSLGEYVAACIQGVFNFEEALRLVERRVDLANSLAKGGMLTAAINETEAGKYLNDNLSIAAINGPGQVVFSGKASSIDELYTKLEANAVVTARLQTSIAFHSEMLDAAIESFGNEFGNVTFGSDFDYGCSIISGTTGRFVGYEELRTAEYWQKQLRQCVNFSGGVRTLISQEKELFFVEIGSGRPLANLLLQHSNGTHRPAAIDMVRRQGDEENDLVFLTERIGRLWLQGVRINWAAFYPNGPRKRIPLPAYSFEPIKFPSEVDPFAEGKVTGNGLSTKDKKTKNWVFYPVWKSALLFPAPGDVKTRTFLVFSNGDAFSSGLREYLSKSGDIVIEVLTKRESISEDRNTFVVNPAETEQFIELFTKLKRSGRNITDIIYCWCLGVESEKVRLNVENNAIHLLYFGIAHIMQAIVENNLAIRNGITVLTDALYVVTGTEKSYAQSLALGLLNSFPQEYPITCRNIDIILDSDIGGVVDLLVAEIYRGRSDDRIVAIRNGRRWVRDYQRDPNPIVGDSPGGTIKQGGVYLITGGLGNVGFIFAKYLITRYSAKVIVIGRSLISDRPEEDRLLRRLRHLESLSPYVKYRSVNIAMIDELRELSLEIEDTFGAINGIIHAAGNLARNQFETVEDTTPENVFGVFAPKVIGVLNLYEVFRDRRLDFVWITSSLASLVGGLRYAAYSSSNAFMEHFISAKSKELPNWICIGLSEIEVAESESTSIAGPRERYLGPEELLGLFELSLACKQSPVIYETMRDPHERTDEAFSGNKGVEDLVRFDVIKAERPVLSSSFAAPSSKTEKMMVALLEDFLGIQGLGVEDNFFDLGGDSLKATSFLLRIRNTFDIHLAVKALFSSPTIRQLSLKIDEILLLKSKRSHESRQII